MMQHRTATREEWLAARLELLEAEKDLTRRSDELARQRQQLPWVRIEKAAEAAVLKRYMQAWEDADMQALAARSSRTTAS